MLDVTRERVDKPRPFVQMSCGTTTVGVSMTGAEPMNLSTRMPRTRRR